MSDNTPVNKTFKLTIDIAQTVNIEEFRVRQGDTGNVLIVTLLDDGEAVDLSDCKVVLLVSHGTKLSTQDNWGDDGGITIGGDDNNVLTIELFSGSFSPGLNTGELQIYSGEALDVLVTTQQINFRCDRSLLNDNTVRASQEVTIIAKLISSVQNLVRGVQSDWAQSSNLQPDYIKNKPTAFTPTAHKLTHISGGNDAITYSDIGASAATHATQHGATGSDPLPPAAIGATVHFTETVTLTVAGWTGDEAPYSQQLLVDSIPAACNILAFAAAEYEEVYNDCEIKPTAQELRKITFQAQDKPESAVNVNILVFV